MPTHASMLRLLTTASMAAVLVASAAPTARAERDTYEYRTVRGGNSHWTADGNLVDVQIRVDGESAPLYFKPGRFDRHYFQAFHGRNYAVALRNTTGRRIGVLIAVDGLNVVNGELSRLSNNEAMYVLDPYEEAVIRGWRTSLDDVRRFVFVDEERSYAERTGQSNSDLGWIRVLAFREVETLSWWNGLGRRPKDDNWSDERSARERSEPRADGERSEPKSRDEASAPEGAKPEAQTRRDMAENRAKLQGEESNPGTGWGERRHDPVRRTEFRAATRPSDQIVLRYEYASGLRALGIYPRKQRTRERDNGDLGFAQPPRW